MWDELQVVGGEEIDAVGNVRVLMDLSAFEGWQEEAPDGNIDFIAKYDERIEKIAVVGNPVVESRVMLFLGAGYRKADVKFFYTGNESGAREWLAT